MKSEKRIFCYCSHGYVPRGVFVRILHENPELHGAKRRFLPFLCIAKRVAVNVVNSNLYSYVADSNE